MEMKNDMIKGDKPFFYTQKSKDAEQKLKEKVHLMKRKIKKSAYDIKEKLRRKSKISRTGNYVSIIMGGLLLIMSWSSQIE